MATREYYAMNPSSLIALSASSNSTSSESPSSSTEFPASTTIEGPSSAQATLASTGSRRAIIGTAVLMGMGLAMMV